MSRPAPGDTRWEGRRRAREAALQMLYHAEVGQVPIGEVAATHAAMDDAAVAVDDAGREWAVAMARGVGGEQQILDGYIGDASRNWRLERLGIIDRLLLRLAVHELLTHPETPPRVVIDEAIELARSYSGEDAAKFVNGVLDGVFKRLKDEGKVVD
jgi:N utilization substance protein B